MELSIKIIALNRTNSEISREKNEFYGVPLVPSLSPEFHAGQANLKVTM